MASDQVQSPFMEARSFTAEESETTEAQLEAASPISPFLSEYQLDGVSEATDSTSEAYMNFLNELYDEEFDEALFELFTEASSLTQDRFLGEQYERDEVERTLEQRFEPLLHETEAMLDTFASSQGERDLGSYSERDLETFESMVDQYNPSIELNPSFENFFGKLKRMVKKVAGGAVNLAKTRVARGLHT